MSLYSVMSILVTFKDFTRLGLDVDDDLTVVIPPDQYRETALRYPMYDCIDDLVALPMQYARYGMLRQPWVRISGTFDCELLTSETDAKGRDQVGVAALAMRYLKKYHSVLLNLSTGYGKTTLSTYLAVQLKYRVLVLCFNRTINKQLLDSFRRTSLTVEYADSTVKLEASRADVVIAGIICAGNAKPAIFSEFGTVVIDEIHRHTMSTFANLLFRVHPRYLIGMTATIDRKDHGHKVFPYFFPKVITRLLTKPELQVIKVSTGYTPLVKYNKFKGKSRPDWTTLITSLADNERRQDDIVTITQAYPQHRQIIVCDRNSMIEALGDKLDKVGESYTLYYGNIKQCDETARVLVAGMKKVGVGYDNTNLNMLILGTDMSDIRQVEGRLRCTNGLIIDLVDDYSTLHKHWVTRAKWYKKQGCTNWAIGKIRGTKFIVTPCTYEELIDDEAELTESFLDEYA